MLFLKRLPLAFAVAALAGCSSSEVFGPSPGTATTSTAWRAAGYPTRDNAEGQARKSARISRPRDELTVGSVNHTAPDPTLKPFSKEWFAQQEALDRQADAALAKKMTICRGCQAPPQRSDNVTRGPQTDSARANLERN